MNENILLTACGAAAQVVNLGVAAEELLDDPRVGTSPYLKDRNDKGRFATDFDDMVKNPNAFKENFHMESSTFFELLNKVEKLLTPKKNTHPNDGISPTHKLAIVLEYLACGTLQRHIASCYRISKQKFGVIIDEVCNALCQTLQDEIPPMTPEELRRIAHSFKKWNFPNCVGAIDGKHVAVKCPPNSGSLFYNYKGFFSTVLMAAADGDYRFVYVDIGAYGSEGDANIFDKCTLETAIRQNKVRFQNELANETPHVFVADDAFPLHRRIMKPFKPKPGKVLQDVENIFNYRLSRARRCVENAFGLMCSKFYCLSRKMFCGPDRANLIIKTCAYLHNFLIRTRKAQCTPAKFADYFNESGVLVEGAFRDQLPGDSLFTSNVSNSYAGRQDESGRIIRNKIANYFISDEGSVEWQKKYAFLE